MFFIPQMFQLDPWFEEQDLVGSGHNSGKSRNGCTIFFTAVLTVKNNYRRVFFSYNG